MKESNSYEENLLKCDLGLYRIYWSDGGSSLASVGQDYDGNRWIAPTNWTCKVGGNPTILLPDFIQNIDGMVKIEE